MKITILSITLFALSASILSFSAYAQTAAYLPLAEVDSTCSNQCDLHYYITRSYHVTTCTDSILTFYDKNNQPVSRILASYDPLEKTGDSLYQNYFNNTWVDDEDFQEGHQDNGCYFSYRIRREFNGIKWDTSDYVKETAVLNNAGNLSTVNYSSTIGQFKYLSTYYYHYDTANKLIGDDAYSYDSKGQLLGVYRDTNYLFNIYNGTCDVQFSYLETQVKDTVSDTWKPHAKFYYTYNSRNQLTSLLEFDLDAAGSYDTVSYLSISYDNRGNQLSFTNAFKPNTQWYITTTSYSYTYGTNNEILREVISTTGVPPEYFDFSDFIPCSASASGLQNVSLVNKRLTIYPNPAASTIEIKRASEFLNGTTAIIYDAIGQALKKFNLTRSNNFLLDIHDLQPGVYLVVLLDSHKAESGEFIKQ